MEDREFWAIFYGLVVVWATFWIFVAVMVACGC
jgi:hypothetical protein